MGKVKSLESKLTELLTKELPTFMDKQVAIKRLAPKIVKVVLEMVEDDTIDDFPNNYDVPNSVREALIRLVNDSKQEIRDRILGEYE